MQERRAQRHGVGALRSFSPLLDQEWTTVAMAYVRELDLLASRHRELYGGAPSASASSSEAAGAATALAGGGANPAGGGSNRRRKGRGKGESAAPPQ